MGQRAAPVRSSLAHTDPETLPDATTWYLVTNLPVPGSAAAQLSELEAASLQDVVRLYGLRMWIEQSYKTATVLATSLYHRLITACRSEERRVGKECSTGWSKYH